MINFLRKTRDAARKAVVSFPSRVKCNICDWSGRRFISDSWHPYTICPNCHSQVRHRLLLSAFRAIETSTGDSLVQNSTVLHFAPEKVLSDLFSKGANRYLTADFLRDDVELRLDMCNMESIETASIDLVVACDVLEHVPDDSKAMNELLRILRPGGCAVLTVPQKSGLPSTYEDSSINTEQGRLEAFGQQDHLRIYGNNFGDVLQNSGFDVKTYDASDFDNEVVRRYVLFPPILSSHPLATNFRKVFFAWRPA